MQVLLDKNHEWLKQMVGEWSLESEGTCGPDQPPMKSTGSEVARMLGDAWLVAEGRATMPDDGGTGYMLLTLGYDPARKRFVGSWVGSMMTHQWIYEGELDAGGKVLTLETEGPSFDPAAGMVRYRDVHEIRSADERTLTSMMRMEDGSWQPFMRGTYRRKK